MSFLARWFARRMWWGMLWLMRQRFMRNAQAAAENLLPERMRHRAHESLLRQNRFARRIGLPMLTVLFNLIFASIVVSATFQLALNLYESGALTAPERLRQKADLEP